jgi:pimeloyl-ACP methyl ester carboxylesterase
VNFISNARVTLVLERWGSGPHVLLFAHGWISSRRMWYDVLAHLDPARYTAHLLDFRGAGLSDRPADGHDLEGYASDLRAAIAAIGEPLDLVAHSMGGKISQYVALDPPANVRRLVLVAPGTSHAVRGSERHRALAEAAFGSRANIRRFQLAAMKRAISPEAMERIVDDALVAQREAWFGWYDYGRHADFSDRVGTIALPVFVLGAEDDPLVSPARLRREVVSAIPGAMFAALRGVGHNIPVEAPAELAQLIDRLAHTGGDVAYGV